jgi:hypothetical protein
MIAPPVWTSRAWKLDLPAHLFAPVLERLRGTPARADDLVRSFPSGILSLRRDGTWSVQEHLGHLVDLAGLDETRAGEFLARADVLSAADMTNAATENARHNSAPVWDILQQLRTTRLALVQRLETFTDAAIEHRSLHPRLKQRMSVVDWMFFVAEHDDHHLAHARFTALELTQSSTKGGS